MDIVDVAGRRETPSHVAGSVGTIVSSRATGRQRRFVLGVALLVAVFSLALLPFVSRPLPEVPQIVPFYVAGVVITDLLTAYLLFSQFHQDRSGALLILAAGYLFTGCIVVPHLLAFPDFTPGEGPLIGGPQSSAWLWHFWHLGFPAIVLAHGLASSLAPGWRIAEARAMGAIGLAIAGVLAGALGLTMLATTWVEALPLLHDGRAWQEPTFRLGWTMAIVTLTAIAVLWVPRAPRTFLHLWLTVALVAFFFDFVPNLLALQRYSVGWYLGRFNGLLAAAFLLAMFLWETNRLYVRLGRTNIALGRFSESLERQVTERTEHLEAANRSQKAALEQRDLLLAEVYHRTKNNLQILDALLALEERQQGDEEARAAFRRARTRISAMALVHQKLLETPELGSVPLGGFVRSLAENLTAALGADARGIVIETEVDDIAVPLETAVPVGLLLNELVSNAVKHAFPDGPGGRVRIVLKRRGDGRTMLQVADTGARVGHGSTAQPSAGTRIIQALTRQIGAESERASAGFTIAFPTGDLG